MRLAIGQLVQCQYQVPGITPSAGVPICTPAQLAAQEAELQYQEDLSVPQGNPLQIGAPTVYPNTPPLATMPPSSLPAHSVAPVYIPVHTNPIAVVAPIPGPVTQAAITQATTSPPVNLSTTPIITNVQEWFTESMFAGIPNWALAAAGVLGVMFLMKGKR